MATLLATGRYSPTLSATLSQIRSQRDRVRVIYCLHILYAAATVIEEDESLQGYTVSGEYVEDLDDIECEAWYVEKFICIFCGNEIERLSGFKEHQWEEQDGNVVCSVCGSLKDEASRIPGDANDDGKVGSADVLLLRRYLAGFDVGINLSNADVSGDGSVGSADVLLLRRYLAGFDVVLK